MRHYLKRAAMINAVFVLALIMCAAVFGLPQNAYAETETVTVGSGTERLNNLPYKNDNENDTANFRTQIIYPADAIGRDGSISSVAYNVAAPNAGFNVTGMKIWMGYTQADAFDWNEPNYNVAGSPLTFGEDDLALVYSGVPSQKVGASEGWETINLNTAFEYEAEKGNLVIVTGVKASSRQVPALEYYGEKYMNGTSPDHSKVTALVTRSGSDSSIADLSYSGDDRWAFISARPNIKLGFGDPEGGDDPVPETDKSGLNEAIQAAYDAQSGVAASETGDDVTFPAFYVEPSENQALADAISAAQAVAGDARATQEEIDAAMADVKAAQEVFETAKKYGKRNKPVITKVSINAASGRVVPGTADSVYKWDITFSDDTDMSKINDELFQIQRKPYGQEWKNSKCPVPVFTQDSGNRKSGVLEAMAIPVNDVTGYNLWRFSFAGEVPVEQSDYIQQRSAVDIEELVYAIEDAKDAGNGVKVSADGKDVDPKEKYVTPEEKKALDDAIEAAESAAAGGAKQEQVNELKDALNTATETFNKAKKDGAKTPDAAPEKPAAKVVINAKTVSAASLKKAIAKAGGTAKSVTTVELGKSVKKINKGTFKGTNVKTLVVKSRKLSKKGVKASLKSSKVKTVQVKVGSKKVNKKYVKKYKKFFTKKNAGKKVKVK